MASVTNVQISRFRDGELSKEEDLLAVEEPLEIRLGYGPASDRQQERLAVTMRTPGQDLELAMGMIFSEGIISSSDEVSSIHYCETVKPEEKDNVIRVELREDIEVDWKRLQRHIYSHAACGVCGKTSIDVVLGTCPVVQPLTFEPSSELIASLPDRLRTDQYVFNYTGGIHAVGLFDKTGQLLCVREDVGRHNALDKLIGHCLSENGIPLQDRILLLSGRISYELVQKATRAGIAFICAVGAPSSLAVNLAREAGISLVGFIRKGYFNRYC